MVAPSRDVRESITLSSWQPHLLQRILFVVVPPAYATICCGVKRLFQFLPLFGLYSLMIRFSLLLFALICVLGCVASENSPGNIRTISKGTFSGVQKALQVVITNQTQWTELWARHSAQVKPAKPAPDINFDKESVVFVCLGQKPSGGHSIEITDVRTVDSKTEITVKSRAPKPGGMQLQALTAPFHIVATPRILGPVKFRVDPRP